MADVAWILLHPEPRTGAIMNGTVTQIDDKGMATVQTEDGKEHKVKGEGWKVGATVQCETKEGKTECKAI